MRASHSRTACVHGCTSGCPSLVPTMSVSSPTWPLRLVGGGVPHPSPPPIGWIDTNNYIVAVHDEPIVMRAFMPNPAGGQNFSRGIAVGLPELINYCFDAKTCMLRYAWTGGFLDMQPSWSGRGGNVVKVVG